MQVKNISNSNRDPIVVRPDHRFSKLAMNSIALAIAVWGGYSLLSAIDTSAKDTDGMIKRVVEIIWFLVICLIFASLLWTAFGAQVISFRNGQLIFRYHWFGLGIGRQKAFEISRVKGVHIEETVRRFKGKETIDYVVSLDYDGIRRPLLERLSSRQAQALRTELDQRLHG
jgi:hypothetical protein